VACQEGFVWTTGEQEFFASKGFTNPPKSCRGNRQARKARRDYGENGARDSGQSAVCPYGEGSGSPSPQGRSTFRPRVERSPMTTNIVAGLTMTGKVARLLHDRHFGFIRDDAGVEYYFHEDGVDDNFYSLTEGAPVSFVTEASPRGPRAKNVIRN
jgi:cold shock CspA family protein